MDAEGYGIERGVVSKASNMSLTLSPRVKKSKV